MSKGSNTHETEKKPVVFVIKNGKAYQVEVVTGISSDTEWEIKQGLEEGWEVIYGPYSLLSGILKDGDMVTVISST